MGPAISGKSSTGEGYELWIWGYCHGGDYAGDQSIKNETAIIKAIAIKEMIDVVIGDHTCNRKQFGVDHDKRSRPEGCVPHHMLVWTTTSDRDQESVYRTM